MDQQQSSSKNSGISMKWGPKSMNIMAAHEPEAVIISSFCHLHEVGPTVYEYHDST
ncbi:hypothetical protein DPMN_156094 [Dreissena polymorpha]|uniref:Uncharacterized protein n=1 Tax=Dreissena polymorpha TaxID=45954 RepID=A0A9D4FP50_DREPO|nr:hypothetical protein DPMN_156094 [Dreissena polymorpha]